MDEAADSATAWVPLPAAVALHADVAAKAMGFSSVTDVGGARYAAFEVVLASVVPS
jgi:hypothetical protein